MAIGKSLRKKLPHHLVFDINDFDETHPAPWEWDIKRLVTSFVIAGKTIIYLMHTLNLTNS